MMQLRLQDFSALVSGAAASVQAASRTLVDLSVGSVLRAILEAHAAVALWLQWLIVQVHTMTRASTSEGADLDSWMADFAVARLPAVAAAGQVRFGRFATTEAALVPVGALVRTADAQQGFVVRADAGHAAWSDAQGGYVMGPGVGSVIVPVQAEIAGSAGNVLPGSITLIADALAGVDTVANDWALSGGLDAESDAALRLRFRDYMASLSRATPVAVGHAVASLQQGLRWRIAEGVGTGAFVVTIDDGSGSPPAAVLDAAALAIEAVRPVGTSFAVQPPGVVAVTVSLAVSVAPGAVHAEVAAEVQQAIVAHLGALGIGEVLPWSRLAQVAYGASPSVVNVSALLLDGAALDVDPGPSGVVRAGSVVVA
jgi:uncharacterized phage protein gp47/JayE